MGSVWLFLSLVSFAMVLLTVKTQVSDWSFLIHFVTMFLYDISLVLILGFLCMLVLLVQYYSCHLDVLLKVSMFVQYIRLVDVSLYNLACL